MPAGRVVALVGPNGSGKTTLMSMAAGLLPVTEGMVEAAGGAPAQRLDRIGFVAQDAPLWPRLRVADVLDIGRCMNPGFDAAMAAERIRRLGIRPRARISAWVGDSHHWDGKAEPTGRPRVTQPHYRQNAALTKVGQTTT